MNAKVFLTAGLLTIAAAGVWQQASRHDAPSATGHELLNVSYDVSRELWRELNAAFIPAYEESTGTRLEINQSHGGSGSQARAVVDGLEADVLTLNLWTDTDLVRKAGLIAAGWEDRFPNRSLPYTSTIVFVVRKGNPKGVHDWPDLIRPGVEPITPNPKTSGNGKLSFLAAWGSVIRRGGTEAQAQEFVSELFRRIPVLDAGGRAATMTFATKNIGDVQLTFENEAWLEVNEAGGELEVVHPPISIRAEPHVAVVDAVVDRKGTREAARAYLDFLYTAKGQEIIARHNLRPMDEAIRVKAADRTPSIELFSIDDIASGWGGAQARFFAEGAAFDMIFASASTGSSS